MHAYFRNHQLYLAERSEWLDRHVVKITILAELVADEEPVLTKKKVRLASV